MEIYRFSAAELADKVNKKEISALEVARAYQKRIDCVEDRMGAFVCLAGERALTAAKKIDAALASGKKLVLAGVPMVLKDNIFAGDLPTTCCSGLLAGRVWPEEAVLARALADAGSFCLGKGNMDEFAMGSSTVTSFHHSTNNPWRFGFSPGGSSGGPAAAVAAGEAAFGIGSDTGGSIRQPAAFCGVVGLKPTFGLVPTTGTVPLAPSFDAFGPLSRTVEDCALILNVLADAERKTDDYTDGLDFGVAGKKIGLPVEYLVADVAKDVKEAILAAAKILVGLGAEVEEVSLPYSKYGLMAYHVLAPREIKNTILTYMEDEVAEGMLGKEVRRRLLLGVLLSDFAAYEKYYLKARKMQALIGAEFEQAFAKFDCMISPVTRDVAFSHALPPADPLEMYMNDLLLAPANLAGIPALSLPCGFCCGLPVGLQILGPKWGEKQILQVGRAFEQATGYFNKVSDGL